MRLNKWVLGVLTGILVAALGVPASSWTAYAQQEGPTKAPPAQQAEPPKPPTGQQNGPQGQTQQQPQIAIAVESNVVNIDAVVTDHEGNIVTNLKKENFRILDDGQPQQVTNFAPTEAPITVVIVMEFSARFWGMFGRS